MTKRILVVDDDTSTAFFLGENLAELGPAYQVETATSGEEAIARFSARRFDLVISDLRMPRMDGLDLLDWIRERDANVRLILMTAYGSALAEAQARRLGVDCYIQKPFRVEELLAAVCVSLAALAPETREREAAGGDPAN